MIKYKKMCYVCRKNWAMVHYGRQRFVVCMECEMKEVKKTVKDKKYKKMFDIPIEWYKENSFLRSVRYQFGRYGELSENQIEAFKKTVKEMKK